MTESAGWKAWAARATWAAVWLCGALHAAAGTDPAGAAAVVPGSWLQENLGAPGMVVVDARPGLKEWLAGHIPGSQPLMVENVRSSDRGVPGQLVPPEVIAVLAGRLGIGTDSRVVVYGAEGDPDASFVATALRGAGLDRVSVLDGGLKRWVQEGRPVTTDRAPVREARLRLPGTAVGVASLDDVRRTVEGGSAILLDVRPAEQFEAGRIPGAVNRFWKSDLEPEGSPRAGLLRDRQALEAQYAALGITRDKPVIVYCNTGHMASHVFHTLRYHLGYPGVLLYDGSMVEWSAVPGLPQEKGPPAK